MLGFHILTDVCIGCFQWGLNLLYEDVASLLLYANFLEVQVTLRLGLYIRVNRFGFLFRAGDHLPANKKAIFRVPDELSLLTIFGPTKVSSELLLIIYDNRPCTWYNVSRS